jgi:hypothetical protein
MAHDLEPEGPLMPVPFPVLVATAILVVGLAFGIIVVGWKTKAIGPGVFYLLAGAFVLMLGIAIAVAVRRSGP